MKSKKLQFFANSLVNISLSKDSLLDDDRISAVVSVLKEQYFGLELKKVLLAYLGALENFAVQTTLIIEHCGKVSDAQVLNIKKRFEKYLDKNLTVKVGQNKDLVAGIRLSVADLVIENSIAGTLNAYRNSVGA